MEAGRRPMNAPGSHIVVAEGKAEIEIRRSRFVALVRPCASPAEAQTQLGDMRILHPKATHHVWAWRLLDPSGRAVLERSDDDGEPGGTAGRPTLQALQVHGIVRGVAVTARYFGGIKLGAGGLVRAYAAAAHAAVAAAVLRPHVPIVRLRIDAPFALLGALEALLERSGSRVLERRFDPDPVLIVEIPAERAAGFEAALRETSGGRATLRLEDGS